jgi:hypothetical protein
MWLEPRPVPAQRRDRPEHLRRQEPVACPKESANLRGAGKPLSFGRALDETSHSCHAEGQTLRFGSRLSRPPCLWRKRHASDTTRVRAWRFGRVRRSQCQFPRWGERRGPRATDISCEPPPPNPPRKAALRGRFAVPTTRPRDHSTCRKPRPDAKAGEAVLAAGGLMRRANAKHSLARTTETSRRPPS